MALADFMNNGQIPTGSAVTDMTTQTALPDWYTNYAMQVLSNQTAASQVPYQTYLAPRTAGFTPTQQQAFGMTGTAATAAQPGLAAAANTAGQAANMSAVGAAQPYVNQGLNTATGAVNSGGGLAAAQPYLTAAGGNATDVSAYMNPYTQNVVDQIAQLGTRNLTDSIMPALEGRYIKSGQFQGSGQMTDTMRAVRDTSNDILGQQSTALQAGYGAAQQAALADLARQGTLAGTAGNLGTAQQQAAMTLAQQQAAAGTTMGGFTTADQAGKLNAATTQGNLATAAQTAGLQGASALGAVGQQQQQLNQTNLDTAYADFLKQKGYPQEQINNMVATMGAVGAKLPTSSTQQGIGPSGVAAQYQPGTLQTIAGALGIGAGALSDFANTPAGKAALSSLGVTF